MLSYLSYLFRLQLLYEDSYLLEGLQSADKTKMHKKAQTQNASTFTGNGSHSHFHQMTHIDAYINFISVTCSPHNAKTTIGRYQRTVLIGRYQLLAKRPIIGHTDYWPIISRCISRHRISDGRHRPKLQVCPSLPSLCYPISSSPHHFHSSPSPPLFLHPSPGAPLLFLHPSPEAPLPIQLWGLKEHYELSNGSGRLTVSFDSTTADVFRHKIS